MIAVFIPSCFRRKLSKSCGRQTVILFYYSQPLLLFSNSVYLSFYLSIVNLMIGTL